MVKLGGRDISVDQGINLAIGAAATIDGAACIFSPENAKNFVVGASIGSTKSLTRLGGSILVNAGVNSLLHGLSNSTTRNKEGLKVNAAALGVASVIFFNEWRNGGDVRSDRVKLFAIASGIAAVGLAVRAGAKTSGGTVTTV